MNDQLASEKSLTRLLILLLIEDQPTHGYDLMKKLTELYSESPQPGKVYRALQWLERRKYVTPGWDMSDANRTGPARRIYTITEDGESALREERAELRRLARIHNDRAARYVLKRLTALATEGEDFKYSLTAQVVVRAKDKEQAEKKIFEALKPARHWQGFDIEISPQILQ